MRVVIVTTGHSIVPDAWGDNLTVLAVQRTLVAAGFEVSRLQVADGSDLRSIDTRGGPVLAFPNGRWLSDQMTEPSSHLAAILDEVRLPYVGSGPRGMAAANKLRMKRTLEQAGVPTPRYVVPDSPPSSRQLASILLPAVVKPTIGAESIGVSLVGDKSSLQVALTALMAASRQALIEEYIGHREFTVAIVGNGSRRRAYPIEIVYPPDYEFLSAELKAHHIHLTPRRVADHGIIRSLTKIANAACDVLHIRDWGRLDVLMAADGTYYVIDVNTLPGLRPGPVHPSYFPLCLSVGAGLTYDEAVLMPVAAAMDRYDMRIPDRLATAYNRGRSQRGEAG